MRLDKRASVIPHGLVARIGVLGENGKAGSDEDEDQEDQREDGVVYKEDDSHDTSDDSWLVKDASEDEEEDGADEVDDADCNVEAVGLLVHVWAQNADNDEEDCLDDNESNCLQRAIVLRQSDEHSFDENISEDWDNKVVGRGLELDVEESPLVERDGIGVENVSRILVHGHGSLRQANNLQGSPGKDDNHGDDGENGENDLTSRITNGKLPKAEDNHLRKANQDL